MKLRTRRALVAAGGLILAALAFVEALEAGFALLGVLKVGGPEIAPRAYRRFGDVYSCFAWAGTALAAGISFVAMTWDPRPDLRRRRIVYWSALFVLLPLSVANYWSGDFYVPRWQQAIIDGLLVVLGLTAVSQLIAIRNSDPFVRSLLAVSVFMLGMQAVAIPAIYGTLWLLNWQRAIDLATTRSVNPSWVSSLASLGSLIVSVLTYRRTTPTVTHPSPVILGSR